MNKRGWYDEMWNPITGTPIISSDKIKSRIKSHCCRFSGDVRYNLSHEDKYKLFSEGYYELDEPFKSYSTDKNFIMAPFGTNPTLHKYRFKTPSERYLTGRILFVNPFADTFLMPHDLPKELTRHNVSEGRKNLRWGKCGRCRKEKPKNEMFRIGVTKGRNCSSTILGFLCDECYDKFKKQFEN